MVDKPMLASHDCDWPEYRNLVIDAIGSTDRAMNEMAKNVSQILQRMVGLEKAWENHQRDTKPLSRAEIELMIEKAQDKKDDGGARLSKDEIKDIVNEVMGARPGNGWPPWKYILLGAGIAIPQIALEVVKVLK